MIPAKVGTPNSNHMTGFLEDLSERLEDSVTSEPLTEAVVLNCGHSLNESTVLLLKKDLSKYLCPECRTPIKDYKVSYALRKLAERISLAPASSEPQANVSQQVNSANEKQVADAEVYYKEARELFGKGFQEESVATLLKAMELNPNNEQAHHYLDFITSPQNERFSSLTANPISPKPSAPPIEDPEKKQSPGCSKSLGLHELEGNSNLSKQTEILPSSDSTAHQVSPEKKEEPKANLSNTAGYFISGYRVENKSGKEIVDAYAKLRELVLVREMTKGTLTQDDLSRIFNTGITIRFKIPLDSLCAEYFHPSTGNKYFIELLEIEDVEIKAAFEHLYKVANIEREQVKSAVSTIPYSKGNWVGATPLDKKKDEALLKLPSNLEHAFQELLPQKLLDLDSPEQRDVFSRRLLFVEYFCSNLYTRIQGKLREKEQAFKEAGNDTQKNKFQTHIRDLRSLLEQLNNFDCYAISKALTTYPIGHIWSGNLDQMAQTLKYEVEDKIHSLRSWWDRFVCNKPLLEVQNEYAQDVAGMLYIDRGRYFDHYNQQNLKTKKESIVDVFMREAILFANVENYTAEGFKKNALIYYFSAELKEELGIEFDTLAALAKQAIRHRQGNEYVIADYPEKSTPADRQKIDQKTRQLLKAQIATHRGRVNYALV